MPPRAKRKRASLAAALAASTRRTRSNVAAGEEAAPVLISVKHERMPKSLAIQRQRGLFLDATLLVGDAQITAHKSVLFTYSPFLAGLFTSGLAESSAAASAPVVIRDVDGGAMAACVDSMYSGTIALTGATVCAVIKAANLLQSDAIEEAACKFFVGRLEPYTALDALGFAEDMAAGGVHGQELRRQVLAYVLEHFSECVSTPALVGLAPSSVAALIESDRLCVESEEVVLTALRQWYEHDMEGRLEALEELVPLVRFPLLPAATKLQLSTEPLLVALGKLEVTKLIELCIEWAPEFKTSAAAACCPRLKLRAGNQRVFTFASVDNTNADGGDRTGGRFDEAGVLHHIATEGGTSPYVNPHAAGRVVASLSSRGCGGAQDFVAQLAKICFTKGEPNSWMAVDLGAGRQLTVNHYALRHGATTGYAMQMLYNWQLQGSVDGVAWTTLRRHDNDTTMKYSSFAVVHWAVEGVSTPYRHFRVHQHGPNSYERHIPGSTPTRQLFCSGIELYGTLSDIGS
jgi:hypothetical protein